MGVFAHTRIHRTPPPPCKPIAKQLCILGTLHSSFPPVHPRLENEANAARDRLEELQKRADALRSGKPMKASAGAGSSANCEATCNGAPSCTLLRCLPPNAYRTACISCGGDEQTGSPSAAFWPRQPARPTT